MVVWFIFTCPSQEPVLHNQLVSQGNLTWEPVVSVALVQNLKKTKQKPSLLSSWAPLAVCGIPLLFLRSSEWTRRRPGISPICSNIFFSFFWPGRTIKCKCAFCHFPSSDFRFLLYNIKYHGYYESRLWCWAGSISVVWCLVHHAGSVEGADGSHLRLLSSLAVASSRVDRKRSTELHSGKKIRNYEKPLSSYQGYVHVLRHKEELLPKACKTCAVWLRWLSLHCEWRWLLGQTQGKSKLTHRNWSEV